MKEKKPRGNPLLPPENGEEESSSSRTDSDEVEGQEPILPQGAEPRTQGAGGRPLPLGSLSGALGTVALNCAPGAATTGGAGGPTGAPGVAVGVGSGGGPMAAGSHSWSSNGGLGQDWSSISLLDGQHSIEDAPFNPSLQVPQASSSSGSGAGSTPGLAPGGRPSRPDGTGHDTSGSSTTTTASKSSGSGESNATGLSTGSSLLQLTDGSDLNPPPPLHSVATLTPTSLAARQSQHALSPHRLGSPGLGPAMTAAVAPFTSAGFALESVGTETTGFNSEPRRTAPPSPSSSMSSIQQGSGSSGSASHQQLGLHPHPMVIPRTESGGGLDSSGSHRSSQRSLGMLSPHQQPQHQQHAEQVGPLHPPLPIPTDALDENIDMEGSQKNVLVDKGVEPTGGRKALPGTIFSPFLLPPKAAVGGPSMHPDNLGSTAQQQGYYNQRVPQPAGAGPGAETSPTRGQPPTAQARDLGIQPGEFGRQVDSFGPSYPLPTATAFTAGGDAGGVEAQRSESPAIDGPYRTHQ
jgi:hypothetical protein